MNVLLSHPIKLQFEVCDEFIRRYPFVRTPVDYKCFHSSFNDSAKLLAIDIDEISEFGVLDGPNGVVESLCEKDGSFAGSIPHDVVWEFVKALAELWQAEDSTVRKFSDDVYVNTTFAYGGRTWWSRLANRFCYRVAFPFGNFLKKHNIKKLPTYSAPLIVIGLLPISLWMFLFNKSYCDMKAVDPPDIDVDVESDGVKKHLVLKPVR